VYPALLNCLSQTRFAALDQKFYKFKIPLIFKHSWFLNTVTAINAVFHTIALDSSSYSNSLSLDSFRSSFLDGDIFLIADTQLYRRLCTSVHRYFSCMSAEGVDGGWIPLSTHPQQFCDPALLVFPPTTTESQLYDVSLPTSSVCRWRERDPMIPAVSERQSRMENQGDAVRWEQRRPKLRVDLNYHDSIWFIKHMRSKLIEHFFEERICLSLKV